MRSSLPIGVEVLMDESVDPKDKTFSMSTDGAVPTPSSQTLSLSTDGAVLTSSSE